MVSTPVEVIPRKQTQWMHSETRVMKLNEKLGLQYGIFGTDSVIVIRSTIFWILV